MSPHGRRFKWDRDSFIRRLYEDTGAALWRAEPCDSVDSPRPHLPILLYLQLSLRFAEDSHSVHSTAFLRLCILPLSRVDERDSRRLRDLSLSSLSLSLYPPLCLCPPLSLSHLMTAYGVGDDLSHCLRSQIGDSGHVRLLCRLFWLPRSPSTSTILVWSGLCLPGGILTHTEQSPSGSP